VILIAIKPWQFGKIVDFAVDARAKTWPSSKMRWII
jgi:hypothetical protein